MKVLHLVSDLDPGGAQHHLLDLCVRLRVLGICSHVLYLSGDGGLAPALRGQGIPARKLGLERAAQFPAAAWRLARRLRAIRPDLVQTHLYHADVLGSFVCLFAPKLPLVSWRYTDEQYPNASRGAALARLIGRRAQRVIVTSEWLAGLSREARVPESKIRLIHLGLEGRPPNRERAAAIRRYWGLAPGSLLIGSVGEIRPERGQAVLLRAFHRLVQTQPDARLVLIGKPLDWTYAEELRRLAIELGVRDRVLFAGVREDLADVLGAFDVFVSSSLRAAVELAILKAMAARTPIVASRVGGIPEVVRDGQNGLLVEPGNPHDLAKAIEQVLIDGQLRRELTQQGARRLKLEFSPLETVRATERVYRELVPPDRVG